MKLNSVFIYEKIINNIFIVVRFCLLVLWIILKFVKYIKLWIIVYVVDIGIVDLL